MASSSIKKLVATGIEFLKSGEHLTGVIMLLAMVSAFLYVYNDQSSTDVTARITYATITASLLSLTVLALASILTLVYATDANAIRKATVGVAIATFVLITAWTILTSKWDVREIVTGFLVGLVGTVVTVVGIQVYLLSYRVGSVGDSVEAARKEITRAVDTFAADQVGSMSSAIRALENALDIKNAFHSDNLSEIAGTLHPGIEAIGLSYKAWVQRLQTPDPYVQRVWRAAFPCFYREEAFDIQGGEIVTNARNYCYLLLRTLSQLLEQSEAASVVYYQVTPVHPKDWYNWPHGFGAKHFYFENEFIGVYHRSLRALMQWSKTNNRALEHGRYVLCLCDSAGERDADVEQFGWDPAKSDEFENPADFWLLDAAVPLSEALWPEPECEFCKAIRKYYLASCRLATDRNIVRAGVVRYAVPQWNCYSWGVPSDPLRAERHAVVTALMSTGGVRKCSCAKGLLDAARNRCDEDQTRMQADIFAKIQSRRSDRRLHSAWERVMQYVQNPCTNFPQLLEAYHLAEVLLSGKEEEAKLIRSYLPALLRTWSVTQCKGWGNLYEVFGGGLHSAPGEARKVKLSREQLRAWPVAEPEFGIFGLRTPGGAIQWKVVIATCLDYPFDVARIRVCQNDVTSAHYEDYQKYERLISDLIEEKILSEKLCVRT